MLVNDRAAKASYRVRANDCIEVELPAPPITTLIPESMPLDIVYEDADIVVVNKPAGLVVHPAAGIERGTLANGLAAHFSELSASGGARRPGIVHRLDRGTSGLLVVAKNELAHQRLVEQFIQRTVEKRYIALVYGQPKSDRGEIDLPIGRHPTHRARMSIAKSGRGRAALTRYQVRARFDEFTLLDVEIKTGRTHQIRVHLAHIHHPVVGDETYGAGRAGNIRDIATRRAVAALGRQFLHAAKLAFNHPISDARLEFNAPLPPELNSLLDLINVDSR